MQRSISERARKYLQKQNQPFLLCKYISTDASIDEESSVSGLISVFAQYGSSNDMALFEASGLLNAGTKPNGRALVYLIRASSTLGYLSYGQQLHCYVLRSGFCSNVFVSTVLIGFYVKFELLSDAHKVFDEIPEPSVVSWNSLISGYVQSGRCVKALNLFLQLVRSELRADPFSFTAALAACGQVSLLQPGMSIHSKVVKLGLEWSVFIGNCLIDMYGKCGYVEEAIQAFNKMVDKDIISWNSVIAACARNQRLEQAFFFFHEMANPDTISYNELISGIAQFGNMEDAIKILSNMPNPNSSSWNSVITGYVNRAQPWEALEFFSEMHSKDVEMDQFTFSSILSGSAGLSALTWGILIHCCTMKYGLDTRIVVGSALIDMYSKCGRVKIAESIFQLLPRKNLITWNAMISGFAHNGNSAMVIQLFEQLKKVRDLKPDGITFLNVLLACWDNQMPLHTAMKYFESMIKDYGIGPMAEHCSSMIRLMGQGGEVWRAQKMIYELGFGSCGIVWSALLGACGACGNLEVAEVAAAKVIELEGNDEFVYVIMSNIYSCYGKWGNASVVRELMRGRGVRKEAGCSWIELENVVSHSSMVQ
ncbi:putative pentatricopeptide repeat-containing protein At5g47460 [Malania oleifera]|uniref:putative pentatricopeptide repeat-containing protein At5g47460 n=1 Tax=Malania oleifera TaxID=397392 RepID=UPI0025AE7C25|nr:putative pentatricopeptide repeat-containing protein At5g47460 [Malania oleifera]